MSITVKLITKKLGFLSSVQPMLYSTYRVILVHRRFLTNQTLSSHLGKLPEMRCLPSTSFTVGKSKDNIPSSKSICISFGKTDKALTAESSVPTQEKVAPSQYNCASKLLVVKTDELNSLLRLPTAPSCGTSDDIILRENCFSFSTSKSESQCIRLNCSPNTENTGKPSDEMVTGRPSEEQLIHVREVLANTLPQLFVQSIDYRIYHPHLLFIDNIRGKQSQGLPSYITQVAILRALGHIKYAYVKFEILKITSHSEDSTVRVRWRIRGIKGYMVVWNVIRHRRWRVEDQKKQQDVWYDGFSTYHVGPDGRVYKHVADKVMPDDDRVVEKTKGTPLAPKLAALCVGLALSAKDSILPTSRTDSVDPRNL